MALYNEISSDILNNILAADEENRKRKQLEAYNKQKAQLDTKYDTNGGGLGGFLGSIVGGIGKGIGDVAKGTFGVIGGGVAGVKDLVEGKAGSQENQNAFKRWLYDAETDKDAAAKAAGTALNAATTLGTTVVPGLAGAGGATTKLATSALGNAGAGAIGGIADEFQQQGANANMESAANRAISGAVAGLATGGLNKKIGNATGNLSSKLLNNKIATSTLGRGALSGAVGGATGAGTSAALGGGDVAQAALQGATSGALAGTTQAGLMGLTNNLATKTRNKLGNTANNTPDDVGSEYTEARAYASKTKKDNVADALENTGKYLQGAQAALNKSDKKAIGVKDTGRFIDGVRRKTGIDVLSKQADFAKEITGGADSILDTSQRNALAYDADGKPFYADTSDIFNGIDDVLRDAKVTSSALGGRKQKDTFVQNLQDDLLDSNGDLLSLASSWHDTAAILRKSDAKGAKIQAKVYETMARKVEDASYSKIPQENVDAMFDVSSMKLREQAKIARQNGNKTAADAYENTAAALDKTPHTIKDFRSFKEDFVKVNKIYDKVLENENGGSVRMARGMRGALNTAKDMLLEKPLYYTASKVGGALSNAGNSVRNSNLANGGNAVQPLSQNTQNLLGNYIGRTEGIQQADNAVQNARKAQDYQNLEDMLAYGMANIEAEYAPLRAAQAQQTSPAQAQLADIANGMSLALAAGDVQSYNTLASLYQTAYKMYELQNPQSSTDKEVKLSKTQQQANAAALALDELENMNPDFGYTVKDIPLLNAVNLTGNKYSSTADSLAMQIGYMLSGANIKEDEAKKIGSAYVPQPFDDEATRKYKLQQARNIIQQYQNTYVTDANNA